MQKAPTQTHAAKVIFTKNYEKKKKQKTISCLDFSLFLIENVLFRDRTQYVALYYEYILLQSMPYC